MPTGICIHHRHFPGGDKTLELLDLPALLGHGSAVDLTDDPARGEQEEADFQPGKAVAEFYDLGFLLVEGDAQPLAEDTDCRHALLQVCFIMGKLLL